MLEISLSSLEIYATRLREDERDMGELVSNCPYITYEKTMPGVFKVHFQTPGLHLLPTGEVVVGTEHDATIVLLPPYPTDRGPIVQMCTRNVRHFHPNIDPTNGAVCYGVLEKDKWAPSIGLDQIVLTVAAMLRLEIFNLESVMNNAEAAAKYVADLAAAGLTPLREKQTRT